MRFYFFFNTQSHTVLCHEMAKHLAQTDPRARFAGVFSGRGGAQKRWLHKQKDVKYELLEDTDQVEQSALTYETSAKRVVEWERRLNCPLMDLIIADRNMGHQYVTDGRVIRTKIMKYSAQEDLLRFLCCFLDTFEQHLTEFRPDMVFIPEITSMSSLALARVCEWIHIPFVVLRSARVGDRFILSGSVAERFQEVEAAFDKMVSKEAISPVLAPEFSEYLRQYAEPGMRFVPGGPAICDRAAVTLRKENFIRFYGSIICLFLAALMRKIYPVRQHHLQRNQIFSTFAFQVKRKVAVRRFRSRKFEQPVDGEPFVFYPLQVSPNALTMVQSPDLVDQLSVINRLAMRMPLTHKLYIKEDPAMIGCRPGDFYKQLQRHANVRLISPMVDSVALLRRASLVVSIADTIGWEAMLMNRPVLMLGESFFSHLGLCHRVNDLSELGTILKQILFHDLELPYGRPELIKFLKCLEEGSFEVPGGNEAFWGRELSPKDLGEKEIGATSIIADKLREEAERIRGRQHSKKEEASEEMTGGMYVVQNIQWDDAGVPVAVDA